MNDYTAWYYISFTFLFFFRKRKDITGLFPGRFKPLGPSEWRASLPQEIIRRSYSFRNGSALEMHSLLRCLSDPQDQNHQFFLHCQVYKPRQTGSTTLLAEFMGFSCLIQDSRMAEKNDQNRRPGQMKMRPRICKWVIISRKTMAFFLSVRSCKQRSFRKWNSPECRNQTQNDMFS